MGGVMSAGNNNKYKQTKQREQSTYLTVYSDEYVLDHNAHAIAAAAATPQHPLPLRPAIARVRNRGYSATTPSGAFLFVIILVSWVGPGSIDRPGQTGEPNVTGVRGGFTCRQQEQQQQHWDAFGCRWPAQYTGNLTNPRRPPAISTSNRIVGDEGTVPRFE